MSFSQDYDIVNSKDWGITDWKSFFQYRLTNMRAKRKPYDADWLKYEQQVEANSYYDNYWQLQVNIPLEKTLKEVYMGRTDGKVNFDVLPDEQTDIEQLQPTKYSMLFFLDWNKKDTFWKENRHFRDIKSTYWSGIYYTGIRSYKDYRYIQKEWKLIESDTDLLKESNFEKIENETWFFFPKSLHVRDFYIDDAAYWQPDVQQAEDCIMKEKVSALEFETRYKDNPNINKSEYEKVSYYTDVDEKNKESQSIENREIVIFHYFHRITKKYLIVVNEEQVIFEWLYLYDDGKLPFVNVQHYTNVNRFRWEGYPERCAYVKAYKSEIWQDILSWSQMANSINLVTWNDSQIGQDWTVWWRGLNIWRSNWWVDQVQPINTNINLGYFTSVLSLLDQQVTVDTWINPLEQFDPWTDKVWIKEIMEASKAVRNKSVDENYNIWLDEALTMMLARIKQFAPALLSETIKNKKGEVIKTIFPKIQIKDYTVKKEKGKQVFTESLWKYGYFELKPEIVQWLWVKVVTPSTNSTLPILERQKVTEYIDWNLKMAQAAALDQTWEAMKELVENMRFEDTVKWFNDAFQIDINWLKANTEKDEIAEENRKKLEELEKALTIKPKENVENITQNPWLWQPAWEIQQTWAELQWAEIPFWGEQQSNV